MTKKKLQGQINSAQNKLDKLKQKHAHWHPADKATLRSLQKSIDDMKARMALLDNPIAKKWVAYCARASAQIDHVLLNDKELTGDERRVLMEKREMLKASLEIFVPKEKSLEILEGNLDEWLKEGRTTPVRSMHDFPQFTHRGGDNDA